MLPIASEKKRDLHGRERPAVDPDPGDPFGQIIARDIRGGVFVPPDHDGILLVKNLPAGRGVGLDFLSVLVEPEHGSVVGDGDVDPEWSRNPSKLSRRQCPLGLPHTPKHALYTPGLIWRG